MIAVTRRIEGLSRSPSTVRLTFALWCLWLTIPYWGLGRHSYVQIHDNADQMFSALVGYSAGVASPSLWAAGWATGVDWLAQAYTNNLYAIPFFFLPAWLAISLVMFTQRFVAGYFMYYLLKDMGAENVACWYAGLAYSLFFQLDSPGFTLFKGFTEAALPLVVWTITRKTNSKAWIYSSAFGIGVLYALSSSFHLSCFAFVLLPIWLLVFDGRTQLRNWAALGFLVLGWLLAQTPAIAATGLNAGMSHRSDWNPNVAFGGLGAGFQELIGVVKYNLVSLIILVLVIVLARHRGKYFRWLIVVLACAAAPITWIVVNRHFHSALGFLSGFNWGRIYLIAPFLAMSAVAIAGSWLPGFRIDRISLAHIMAAATVFVFLQSALLNASIFHAVADGSNYAEFYHNADLVSLAREVKATNPPYRIACVGIHPGFMWAYGFETADGYLNLYPKRYQDFWKAVNQKALQQDTRVRNYFENYGNRIYLFVPGGNPAGALKLLSDSTTSVKFEDSFNLDLLSLANVKYIISTVPLDDPNLVLRPSSIRDGQIAWQKQPRRTRYLDVLLGRVPGIPLYIYENKKVLPRFFCAEQVLSRPPKQVNAALAQLSSDELRTKVFLPEPEPSSQGITGNHVVLSRYSATCIDLEVAASAECPLVIANNYSPYWLASIDGKQGSVLLADATFQAIEVPPGKHNVRLEYSPPYAPSRCSR